MQEIKVIEFQRTRDFGTKMNATVEFVRQNVRGLGKSLLFLAGPPALIAGVLMGNFFQDFMSYSLNPSNMELFQEQWTSLNFWLEMLMMVVFGVVAMVMVTATTNNYLILYGEKRSNEIEVSEVWERVRSSFWMYFGTIFSFWVIAIVLYIGLILLVVALAAVTPYLVILAAPAAICALCYAYVAGSLTFTVRTFEPVGLFPAIGRSFKLTYGKWWSTFGLMFALATVTGIACYVFMIPFYAVTFSNALHATSMEAVEDPSTAMQTVLAISTSLYFLASIILGGVPVVGLAFQYFNLVELKEARGLMGNIDSFGQPKQPTPTPDEQY